MNMGKRIELRLRELGWQQVDLLRRVPDMGAGTLSATIKRDAKKSDFAAEIANALGVRLEWLQTGQGPMEGITQVHSSVVKVLPSAVTALGIGAPIITWDDPSDLPDGQYVIVPRYDVHASAGNGHAVYEELELAQGQSFRADWLKRRGLHKRHLRCLYAKGHSMSPVICDGFSILVNIADTTIQDGKIYVLRYGDEIRVKYLHRRFDGGLIIRSANRDEFPDVDVKAEDMQHIDVLGRVVHVSGDY